MDEFVPRIGLPKWPQMLVTGTPVTKEQALEIIRRTDRFFSPYGFDGNDRPWIAEAKRIIKKPSEPDWKLRQTDEKAYFKATREYHEALEVYAANWGFIDTEYVHNDWVSSSFIGGPHGWCHPDGTIGFTDNVGKWPSIDEIKADWEILAAAFPFIDIGVTLMSEESCLFGPDAEALQSVPVVSMRVKGGKVTLVDPALEDVHATAVKPTYMTEDELKAIFSNPAGFREHAVELDQIQAWADQVYSK